MAMASKMSRSIHPPWSREIGVPYSDSDDMEIDEKRKSVKSKSREKKYKHRVVEKSGHPNIQYKNISKRRRKYFSDLYTTLVDSRYLNLFINLKEMGKNFPFGYSWIESLLMFATSFYLTWLLFAVTYYLICYGHGDLEEDNLKKAKNNTWTPCISNIEDFASSFLFSLETQVRERNFVNQ